MKIFVIVLMMISSEYREKKVKRVLKLNVRGRKLIADDFKFLGVVFFGFLLTIVVMGVLKHGFGIDLAKGGASHEENSTDKNYTDIQIDYRVKPYLKEIYHKLSLPFNFISAKEASEKHSQSSRKLKDISEIREIVHKIDKKAV